MSVDANWIWNAETPCTVPAGARISAGKSGRVARSLPSTAVAEVNAVARQLHPVARVSGEPDDDALFDFDGLGHPTVPAGFRSGLEAPRHFRGVIGPSSFQLPRSPGQHRPLPLDSEHADTTTGIAGPRDHRDRYGAWEAGGADWGPNESEDAVIAAMHAALDAGIGWIDTAEVYGSGVSETLVGRAVAGRRDDLLIFTKVATGSRRAPGSGPSRVRAACDAMPRAPGHRSHRPVPAPLAGRHRRAPRGHVGRHGGAGRGRQGAARRRRRTSTASRSSAARPSGTWTRCSPSSPCWRSRSAT
jgi:hypothetical protein